MQRRNSSLLNVVQSTLLPGLLLGLTACGGASPQSPASPAAVPTPVDLAPTYEQVEASFPEGVGLLMAADVTIHLDDLRTEITPLRRANLTFGEEFPGVNLTQYLQANPCATCLRLESVAIDPVKDLLYIAFAIRHPFAQFPVFPRKDLDTFDVKGVMLIAEPTTGAYTFNAEVAPGVKARGDFHSLRNADGYTSAGRSLWTDPTFLNPAFATQQSTLNPFKFFQSDGTERRFRQGQGFESRTYEFDLSRQFNTVRFLLAITSNYGTPIRTRADRPDARYFVPWFNQKEAYYIHGQPVFPTTPMVWKDATSMTNLEVFVADHQGARAAKDALLDWDDPADTLAFPSNVAEVSVEIPAISNTPFSTVAPTSGTGSFEDPFRYGVTVANNKAASFGTYPMLIKTRDQYNDALGFTIGKFVIPYDDDFERENSFTQTGWVAGALQPGTGPGWTLFNSGGSAGKYLDENNNQPYENNVTLTLDTPVFDLTFSGPSPVLQVDHNYDLEYQLDGGTLFLSTDGGFSFDYSAPIPVNGGQGYDVELLPKITPGDVTAYKFCFSGNHEGGVSSQFDLSKAAGKKAVVVRFVFSTNGSGGGSTPPFYKGWSIYHVAMIP